MKSTAFLALLVSGALHLHGCSFPTSQMYAGDPFLGGASSPSAEAAGRAAVASPATPFDPTQDPSVAHAQNPFPVSTPPVSTPVPSAAPVTAQLPAENPDIQTHTAVAEPPAIAAKTVVAAKPVATSQWRPSSQREASKK